MTNISKSDFWTNFKNIFFNHNFHLAPIFFPRRTSRMLWDKAMMRKKQGNRLGMVPAAQNRGFRSIIHFEDPYKKKFFVKKIFSCGTRVCRVGAHTLSHYTFFRGSDMVLYRCKISACCVKRTCKSRGEFSTRKLPTFSLRFKYAQRTYL